MLWHTEMASGIHLGILLICLVQAEHVSCLWDTQADGFNSKRQTGNKYVGFSQQESGLRQLSGSYPQNQFRPASIAPGSTNSNSIHKRTVVSGGSTQLSSRGYTQILSPPGQSDKTPVSLVHQNSYGRVVVAKPSWRTSSHQVESQSTPNEKGPFGLSTAIASGSSVTSKSRQRPKLQHQNDLSDASKRAFSTGKGTWPVQSSTLRTGQYLSSPVQSPSRESYSFTSASHQPAGQSSSTATKTPAYYGQSSAMLFKEQSGGLSPSNGDVGPSRLFTRGRHVPQQDSSQLKSSASSPARRVSLRRTNFEALKVAPRAYDQSGSTDVYNPSYSQGVKTYRSLLFSANGGGNVQGEPNFIPRAVKSSSFSHGQPAPAYGQNPPSGLLQQHGVQTPITRGHVRYQASYTSTAEKHIPNSVGSPKVLWNSRTTTQEAHNLPASGSGQSQNGRMGTSGPRFAPTVVHKIPKPYGGFPIRRLRDPVESIADVKRPQPTQLTYTEPPQQRVSTTRKAQDHKNSKWMKIRLG